MIGRLVSSAAISLALAAVDLPANAQDVSGALLTEAALCKSGMPSISGKNRHLDTFPQDVYRILSKGRRFPIHHAGESHFGMLFVSLDLRHRIIGAYTKYYTWGEIRLRKTNSLVTDLPSPDLSQVATVNGIRIGATAEAVARLPGPKTTWMCGGAQQILYANSCDSIQFTLVEGRVVAIDSGYGGC